LNSVTKGANVINLSLGTFNYYDTSADYYQDLYYNQGILLVAASGNVGTSVLLRAIHNNNILDFKCFVFFCRQAIIHIDIPLVILRLYLYLP